MATIAARAELPKAIVLYDGKCRLCQRSVALLQRLDWFRNLSYQDGRDTASLPETNAPLIPSRLLEAMHVVTSGRPRVFQGFAAFRWMAWRLPICWPIAPFLYLPGVPLLGRRVYGWVARNRFHMVPCHGGQCELQFRD